MKTSLSFQSASYNLKMSIESFYTLLLLLRRPPIRIVHLIQFNLYQSRQQQHVSPIRLAPLALHPLIWRLVHRKWTILYRWNQSLAKQVCPLRYLLNLPRLSWLTNLLISILFFLQSSHLSSVLERLPSHQYVSFCHHWFFSPSPAI